MTVGENIKKLRKEKNIKQQDLAETLGIPQSHLSSIENDKKGLSKKMASKLALALDMKVDDILSAKPMEEVSDELKKQWIAKFKGSFELSKDGTSLANELFDFHTEILPKINALHKMLFEDPYKKMTLDFNNGKDIEAILKKNSEVIKIINTYAKTIVEPINGTMKSVHQRRKAKELEKEIAQLYL
jgi:putative transcriptional regulator